MNIYDNSSAIYLFLAICAGFLAHAAYRLKKEIDKQKDD